MTQVVEQKIIATSANVRFESLKNQLDPHFLFNSLNVLCSLIDENPHKAQEFTASMSKIYRYILDKKDQELVSVEEELDFAETYCEMLSARFEDSISFHFEIEPEVKKPSSYRFRYSFFWKTASNIISPQNKNLWKSEYIQKINI